ncbi:hypothetical protein PRRU23_25550 [Segatella bryantii]|uniref:Uncharacterized protein n=1 Tax=Segatella bryantii TaxID=77095 RepID=A0AA37ME27_SEGBR|nr:hypothetical protein PRRU23_25550 [Segatella bryantii]
MTGFKHGRNRQTDGFFGSALVCYNKIGSQRIETSGYTFHRTVVRLQIDGYIYALFLFDKPIPIIYTMQKYEKKEE